MTHVGTVARTGLALALACLAVGAPAGSSQRNPRYVEYLPILTAAAERENKNFVCVSGTGDSAPTIERAAAEKLTTFASLVAAQGQPADELEGITWIRWQWHGGPLTYAEGASIKAIKGALSEAANELGLGLLASLSDEQNQLLARPWRGVDMADVHSWRDDYFKMGGCLTGDKMTEFQRRLCAAAVYASTRRLCPWEKLLNCEEAAVGDFDVDMTPDPFWLPEIQLCNRKDLDVDPGMRRGYYDTPYFTIQKRLPAEVLRGQGLAALAATLPPRPRPRPPDVALPEPECRHRTDGPTRVATALLDPDEAKLMVAVPADVGEQSYGGIAQGFAAAGFKFIVPPYVLGIRYLSLGGGETVPGMSLLYFLNTVTSGYEHAAWVREGMTFRLVQDWEQTGNTAIDGTKLVPPEFLEKPVTFTAEATTVSDLLAAIREQTGVPVYPTEAVEEEGWHFGMRFKDVPVRAIVRQLAAYLDGAWERGGDGKVCLVPRTYLQVGWRDLHPSEAQKRRMTTAGMALSLLVETLTPDEWKAASEGELALQDIGEVSQHLLSGLAHSALGIPDALPEGVKLSGLHQSEGGYSATVSVGGKSQIVASIDPPTIPPNPPGEHRLMVRGGTLPPPPK